MSYDSAGSSDSGDYSEWLQHPSVVKAKRTWKKLFKIILDKRTDIPLKQMAIKAKHENVLFNTM